MAWPLDPDVQLGDAGHIEDTNSIIARLRTHDTMFTDLPDTLVTQATAGLDATAFGVVGDGTTDDTAAIQAALDALEPGQTLMFPPTGSGAWFKITSGLTVTTPNIRMQMQPRDAYAASIRCAVPGVTMLTVKTTGFVARDMALWGDVSVTNGVGATVTCLDLFGDVDGNIDADIRGVTFQGAAVCVRVRARNTTIEGCLFSNALKGVVLEGKDAVYHTGPNADQNRGNTIRGNRFHNIGGTNTDAAVEITTTAKVLHALIVDNYFDSNGIGRHIVATGTLANPHKGLSVTGNKHTETRSDVYALTYVNNSVVRDADINGNADVNGSLSNGVVLNNCDNVLIRGVNGLQLGVSGVYARNSTGCSIIGARFKTLGTDAGTTGHGFDVDSTCSGFVFDQLRVDGTDGYGFTGSPGTSSFGSYTFTSCTLGQFNSTTVTADMVFLPATSFIPITGTPNVIGVTGVGYPAAYQFDATTAEQVTSSWVALPNDWQTFDAYVTWAASDGSAGSVVWNLDYSFLVAGQLTSNGNVSNPGTAQASPGVAGRVNRYKIAANKTRSTAPMVVRVTRSAAAGGDTYAADAQLIGVELVRAS